MKNFTPNQISQRREARRQGTTAAAYIKRVDETIADANGWQALAGKASIPDAVNDMVANRNRLAEAYATSVVNYARRAAHYARIAHPELGAMEVRS